VGSLQLFESTQAGFEPASPHSAAWVPSCPIGSDWVVELKDTMIIQPTLLALQSLLVLQKLLSILIDTFFSSAPGHV